MQVFQNNSGFRDVLHWINASYFPVLHIGPNVSHGKTLELLSQGRSFFASGSSPLLFSNSKYRGLVSLISLLFTLTAFVLAVTRIRTEIQYRRDVARALSRTDKCLSDQGGSGTEAPSATPIAPYWVPFVAHGVDLLRGSKAIAKALITHTKAPGLINFPIFGTSIYFISDPAAITQVWRSPKDFSFIEMKSILLERSFGVPTELIEHYRLDDSGTSGVPRAGSNVAPRDRYLASEAAMLRQMLGPLSKARISAGYTRGVVARANQLRERIRSDVGGGGSSSSSIIGSGICSDDGTEWLDMPCLWLFLRDLAFSSSLDSFCGPDLLRVMPDFLDDFWVLDENITKLSRKLPRWLIPGVYRARDKCRAGIKAWRERVSSGGAGDRSILVGDEGKQDSAEGDDGPCWGVRMTEIRNEAYNQLNLMDDEARAAFDLALIWASHSNPVAATFWIIYEVVSSSSIRNRCLVELDRLPLSTLDSEDPSEAIVALGSSHILQAIFAETLRLYVTTTNLRRLQHHDSVINGMRIPQGSRILFSAHAQHKNPALWTTSSKGQSLGIEDFCPERFLVPATAATESVENTSDENLVFSTDGLAGTFLPFGGGPSICPGREYAKDQALTTLAILLREFEFEVLQPQDQLKADSNRYGAGTLVPERRMGIKFRVRERRERA